MRTNPNGNYFTLRMATMGLDERIPVTRPMRLRAESDVLVLP